MKNKYPLITTLIFLCSSPALAGGYTQGHIYLGMGVGATHVNARTSNFSSPNICSIVGVKCSIDNNDKSWQLYGGYQISPHLAIEGTVIDLGRTANINDGTVRGTQETKSVAITAVGKVPLGGYASLYGKAGIHHWDSDTRINNSRTSASGTDPVVGLGMEYKMAPQWTARMGWDRYFNVGKNNVILDSNGPQTLKTDVDVYTIGIHYNF